MMGKDIIKVREHRGRRERTNNEYSMEGQKPIKTIDL